MTGSCVGMKTGQFLKLFGVASVLLNLCLLGFYEGYKKDYWDLGQSLASYHEMRVDMNHNIWNATQTHNRLVYEKTMAEQKQLLYQLLNSTRSDERTQNLVQRINDDIQSNAEIVDEIEQNMYNNGFSDNEGGYSPITSYMTYTRLFQTPLDDLFYVSTVTLFFSMLGIYGVTCKQRSLVQTYLIFNLAHLVLSFTLFVDIIGTSQRNALPEEIKSMHSKLSVWETLIILTLLSSFLLDIFVAAIAFKALRDIKEKRRDEYSQVLNFEV